MTSRRHGPATETIKGERFPLPPSFRSIISGGSYGDCLILRGRKIGVALVAFAAIATAFALPPGERRSVGVQSADGKAGVRSIRPLTAADHQCNHFGTLSCPGSSSSGELSTADCRLNDGSWIDLVQFSGIAGETVTIDMTSAAFDTYLFLLDPTPTAVASNDDFGAATNSRIVFTLTTSGTWTIGATSFLANQTGPYALTILCTTAPATTPTPTPTPTPTVPPVPTFTPIPGPCVPDATTLCLNSGRFRVQANWETASGQSGLGIAIPETSDTGMFWFFSANNLEILVKVVNGCSFNQRYWVFAGGLTNVRVAVTVTDTQTATVRTYVNPQGVAFAPIQDAGAYATCP